MITLDAITLHEDLIWIDEFDWSPVQQSLQHSLSGALIIETGVKQAGRPITLEGGRYSAWIMRSVIKTLYAKLTAAPPFVLTLNDARTFNVTFAHGDKPIDAKPIIDYNLLDDSDVYSLTLRFITV